MKPTLLFYCQHSLGIGHLTRSFALAQALKTRFHVVFLNGGPLPPGVTAPEEVELIHLPPLGMDDGHTLVSRAAGQDVEDARVRRRALLLRALAEHRPAVLLIELFPFGRKKFAGEILPLIRAARGQCGPRPAVVCSLRDLLVSARPDQQRHDDRARWLANRYFDAVLVHADPGFARLEESFRPGRPLRVPVLYTGFVTPQRSPLEAAPRERRVLVSAGGGIVGYPLFRAALAAHRHWWAAEKLATRIIAGPFLPETEWQALQEEAQGMPGVKLLRHVPDLCAEMRRALVSVSQCGYNSALDMVAARVPALLVPYAPKGENEQLERAQRLQRLGVGRLLHPAGLDPARLADEVLALLSVTPPAAAIRLDGAERSTELLQQLCAEAKPLRVPAVAEA